MGLLATGGAPMKFDTPENAKAIPYVQEHGVEQFINVYNRYKDIKDYPFLWGEELEHLVVAFAKDGKSVKLSLTADEIMQELRAKKTTAKWLPEYGSFMIETTPSEPYSSEKAKLLSCEDNLEARYAALREVCKSQGNGASVVTVVSFPMMGVGNFVAPDAKGNVPKPLGEYAQSLFVPDECINQTHPRFSNLTRNIRLRRGRKVCIQIPMFIDKHTLANSVDEKYRIDKHPMNSRIDCAPVKGSAAKTSSFSDDDEEEEEAPVAKKGAAPVKTADEVFSHLYTPATNYYYAQYTATGEKKAENVIQRFNACPCPVPAVSHPCVYMDCMAFGMGSSCLQVTMQFKNVAESRHIFDQLTVLCPMMLALTSATPIQKGFLCDSDVRWLTIAASVDCRKRDEVPRIIKSRYDSVSLYISPEPEDISKYNDNHVEIDPKMYQRLKKEGLDDRLANHVSHLFIRDPLVIFDERVDSLDDKKETDHFENIQSTNWQTVRFKPPPFDSDIGWRVEFRVMDVSVTAFENAAFSVFTVLLTQAILKYKLWLYVPMSKVDENMGRAHFRDPVKQKYWWAKDLTQKGNQGEVEELTTNELFNGEPKSKKKAAGEKHFEGFVGLVRRFATEQGTMDEKIERYLSLISRRASGELLTTASFFREFVTTHPDYKGDSRVSDQIAHDLLKMTQQLADGEVAFENFLPAELMSATARRNAAAAKRQRDE